MQIAWHCHKSTNTSIISNYKNSEVSPDKIQIPIPFLQKPFILWMSNLPGYENLLGQNFLFKSIFVVPPPCIASELKYRQTKHNAACDEGDQIQQKHSDQWSTEIFISHTLKHTQNKIFTTLEI